MPALVTSSGSMFQQTSFVDSEKKFRDHGYEPYGEAHVHHSSVLDQMAPETQRCSYQRSDKAPTQSQCYMSERS